jgi:hypothetical protein
VPITCPDALFFFGATRLDAIALALTELALTELELALSELGLGELTRTLLTGAALGCAGGPDPRAEGAREPTAGAAEPDALIGAGDALTAASSGPLSIDRAACGAERRCQKMKAPPIPNTKIPNHTATPRFDAPVACTPRA